MYQVHVKWGKNKYTIALNTAASPLFFKSQLHTLTGVKPEWQKITTAKGILKDDAIWSTLGIKDGTTFMLIGTAEERPETPEKKEHTDKEEEKEKKEDKTEPPLFLWNLLFKFMYGQEFVILSQLSRQAHKCVKPTIEFNFTFRIPLDTQIKVFAPRKVIMESCKMVPSSAREFTLLCKPPPDPIIYYDFHLLIPLQLQSVTVLNYRGPVDLLPRNLTRLSTSDQFNEMIDSLPPTVTHLTLGNAFNQPLDVLPANLTHLTNHSKLPPINSHVPITHLSIRNFIDRNYHIPLTVTHLTLEGFRDHLIGRFLPPTLTHLTLSQLFLGPVDDLPSALTHLIIGYNIHGLPKTKLNLGGKHISQHARLEVALPQFNRRVDNLSVNLTFLTLGGKFNRPLNNLPPSLTRLYIGGRYMFADVDEYTSVLPSSFKKLESGSAEFNQPVDNLPKNLTHLALTGKFNQPVNNLPQTLTHLTLAHNFDHEVNNLPLSLRFLTLGYKFSHSLNQLPPNLYYLEISEYYKHSTTSLPFHLCVIKSTFPPFSPSEIHEDYSISIDDMTCL